MTTFSFVYRSCDESNVTFYFRHNRVMTKSEIVTITYDHVNEAFNQVYFYNRRYIKQLDGSYRQDDSCYMQTDGQCRPTHERFKVSASKDFTDQLEAVAIPYFT